MGKSINLLEKIKNFFVEGKHARNTRIIGFWCFIVGVIGLIFVNTESVLSNVLAELLGIGITVGVIDYFYDQRATSELKATLVRDLGSEADSIVKGAIRALLYYSNEYDHDWLYDGSLDDHKYSNADWSRVTLRQKVERDGNWRPCFRNAIFFNVNFKGATLHDVDFSGSNFINSKFHNADLNGSIFKNCRFGGANFKDVNLADIDFICSDIQRGQILQASSIFQIKLPNGQLGISDSQQVLINDPENY